MYNHYFFYRFEFEDVCMYVRTTNCFRDVKQQYEAGGAYTVAQSQCMNVCNFILRFNLRGVDAMESFCSRGMKQQSLACTVLASCPILMHTCTDLTKMSGWYGATSIIGYPWFSQISETVTVCWCHVSSLESLPECICLTWEAPLTSEKASNFF